MADDGWGLTVCVEVAGDDDREVLAVLTLRLRAELLELDLETVESVGGAVSAGAKAGTGLVEILGIRLGTAGLRAVVAKVRDWATRNGRSVEVTIDGDTLKVTGVSPSQQEQLINVWLEKHVPTGG